MKRELLAATALVFLTVLMVLSLAGVPWNPEAQTIPNEDVAVFLFADFTFSVIVIALVLAVAMISGVFLAREEGGP